MRRVIAVVLLVGVSACGGVPREAAPKRMQTPRATLAGDPNLEPANDFTLATFDGGSFTLSDHFGELPVVLNFWAPW